MTNTIVIGGGCFWCIEAALKQVSGVKQTVCGYAGGSSEDPSYREVCSGSTGHAEVVKVTFDEEKITLSEVLDLFFKIHNPTTLDKEGPDIGSQYRSIILYEDEETCREVENKIEEISENYSSEIVTEVKELQTFYKAEEKHQDYFEKNPDDAYCKMHAQPKIDKIS